MRLVTQGQSCLVPHPAPEHIDSENNAEIAYIYGDALQHWGFWR